MEIAFTAEPGQDDIEAVVANIASHAEGVRPGANYRDFAFLLKDDGGAVVGGLTGYVLYDWIFVQYLSVPESLRGSGQGRQLMETAEAWGRAEGLVGIWLETFDFQAPGFYEKLGFSRFGEIEDHPPGSRRIFFKKRIAAPTA